MKTTHQLFRPALKPLGALLAAALCSSPTFAATINKADNADDLNLTTSWSGGVVPGAADVARWDSAVTGASAVLLGANASWLGLVVADPGGAVTIGAGNTLTLGTAGIDMSAATQNLTISSGLTLGAGNQVWNVASGRTLTLNTGAFTRSAGATLNLQGSGTFAASMTGLANGASGIIGPWAGVGTGTSARFATLSSGNLVGYTAGTATTWGGTLNSATVNYEISAAGASTYGGSQRIANTIRYTGPAGTTVTLGNSANGAGLTANGILNAGTGSILFNTAGSGTAGFVIGSSAPELVLSAANAAITITAPIHNQGTTAGVFGSTASAVTVTGPNTVTLGGANTYTGGTRVNSGTLILSGTGGSGAITVNHGATITFGGNTYANSVSGSGTILNNTASTTVFTGDHSGFSGSFTHNAGANNSQFNSATSGSENAAYTLTAGELIFAANGNYTVKMGSLASAAGNIRGGNSATGTTTLEVGNRNTNTSIAGNLNNGTTKVMALTKVGTGTLTLNGNNNYSGPTAVNNGTLALGASGAINNSTSITVANGATFDVSAVSGGYTLPSGRTLSGSGTAAGSVVAAATSHIIPGTSPGTLTFSGNLTLSGATNTFELSTSAVGGNDKIVVGGNLSLGAADTIRISALDGAADLDTADYVLFEVSGTTTMATTPALAWVGTMPGNAANYVIVKDGNNVVLRFTTASAPTVAASVSPASATRNQAVTLTAFVTAGSGNIASVTADLTQIGGSPAASLILSNDFVYTNSFIVAASTTPGLKSLGVTVADDTSPTPLTDSDVTTLTVTAASQVWDGGSSTDDNWTSNENWLVDTGPGFAGDSVTFAGTTRLTPDMDASYAVTGVTFDATAGSFTLGTSTSSTLTNTGGIVNNSANPQTVNVPLVLTAAQSLNAAAGDLAFGGAVAYGANTLAVPGASNVTFSSSLSGTADFNKTGAGTLTFGGSANAGQFNLDRGTVGLAGSMTATGGGNRIRVGNGTGNLGVLNVENGSVATANWSLVAGSDTSTGVINVNGGTLIHQGGLDIYLGSGSSGSTGILNLNSGTLSNRINGIIIGESGTSVGAYNQSGGLGLLGTNILVGQTANTNQFNLSGGTANAVNLFLGRGNGAGTATLSGGTLNLGGLLRVGDGVNASSTGTGLLTVSNTAVLNVENDLVLGFAGAGNLGRMVIEGGTVNVASTATRWLILGQWDTTRGQLDINGGQLNLNAGTSLKYSVGGSGTASTNVVNLNGGSITFYSDNGTTVGGGGMVDLAQSGSANARNTFNLNGGTLTTPGVGASSVTPTRIFNFNGGTLRAAANSATFLQGLSTANVQAGGAVIDTDGKTITIAQNLLNGGGGLTKLGAGTLYLNGVNTYTGDTVVSAGTLGGSGTIAGAVNVAAGGTLAPGTSIGTLTINNSLTLAGNTVLEINKAAGPALTSDLVAGVTTLNCGGTVTVVPTGDALAAGDEFTVFSAGAFSGAFTSITPAPGAGLAWDTTKLAADGKLLVHANPIANTDEAGATHGQTTTIAVAKLLMNDTGEPGETLSIIDVSANASLSAGIVTYTAPMSGTSDVITYTLSDGRGGTATGTINVALSSGAGGFNQLSATILGGGNLQLTYLGIPGTNYALEVTHDLAAPVIWTPIVTNAAGANGLLIFTNTPSLAPTNDYYRTRYAP